MLKTSLIFSALFLVVVFGVPIAHADTFDFAISGADTGTIAITESGGAISMITGTFDGSTIYLLLTPGHIGDNDNKFSPTAPYLDNSGVSFSLDTADTNGWDYVNLFSLVIIPPPPNTDYQSLQANNPAGSFPTQGFGPDTITLAPTPEPGVGILTLFGIGIVFLMRKRVRQDLPRTV
jgi:hypothetical protein